MKGILALFNEYIANGYSLNLDFTLRIFKMRHLRLITIPQG